MIRFQADADLRHTVVKAVKSAHPLIDFWPAAEAGLIGLSDPDVLEIAAKQDRMLVTHDRRTMPGHFLDRLSSDKASPGIFIVSQFEPIGSTIEVLALVWETIRSHRICFLERSS